MDNVKVFQFNTGQVSYLIGTKCASMKKIDQEKKVMANVLQPRRHRRQNQGDNKLEN